MTAELRHCLICGSAEGCICWEPVSGCGARCSHTRPAGWDLAAREEPDSEPTGARACHGALYEAYQQASDAIVIASHGMGHPLTPALAEHVREALEHLRGALAACEVILVETALLDVAPSDDGAAP